MSFISPISFGSSEPAVKVESTPKSPAEDKTPSNNAPVISDEIRQLYMIRERYRDQFEQCQAQLPKEGPDKNDIHSMNAIVKGFKFSALGAGALLAFSQSLWAIPFLAWPVGSEIVQGIKKLSSD